MKSNGVISVRFENKFAREHTCGGKAGGSCDFSAAFSNNITDIRLRLRKFHCASLIKLNLVHFW